MMLLIPREARNDNLRQIGDEEKGENEENAEKVKTIDLNQRKRAANYCLIEKLLFI